MSTGYENAPEDLPPPRVWKVERNDRMFSSAIVANVTMNGAPRGFLYLDSQEELEWVMKRLNGTQP